MTEEIIAKNSDLDSEDVIDPDDVSAELNSEIVTNVDNNVGNDPIPNSIESLRASTPPLEQMQTELVRYADRKLSIYERRLAKLDSSILSSLPDYISAISDVREMNKLKYRLGLYSYDELKSLWLKYIHDIL